MTSDYQLILASVRKDISENKWTVFYILSPCQMELLP